MLSRAAALAAIGARDPKKIVEIYILRQETEKIEKPHSVK